MRKAKLLVGWVLLATAVCSAQFNSNLQGVVQDPSGSLVPGASIRLQNVQTGIRLETKTNDSGFYRFSSLAPGKYEVAAEAPGFREKIIEVELTTGQSRDVNFSLEVAVTKDTVVVRAEAPILDTAETRLQLTMKQEKLRDLPLLNNSIFALLALAPGVTGTNTAADNFRPEYFSGMSANGRSAYGNTFNVDGISVTSNITNGTANLGVNPEAVGEVAIETNTFKAEQGLGSSIVVSINTKSGTNEFHGAANYWYTNQDMRARTSLPFVARWLPFSRQNVNAALGGPVVKNRTFFFSSVELLRQKDAASSVVTYESPQFVEWAQRTFPNTLGTRLLRESPADAVALTNPNFRNAQQVLGNVCGTDSMAMIPCDMPMLVQGTWNRAPWFNGLQYNFRGDQYFREGKDRVNGTFFRTESDNLAPNPRTRYNTTSRRFVNAFQSNWTRTLSPTLLNEFGVSGNRVLGEDGMGAPWRIPSISVQGSQGLGNGFGGTFVQNNWNWREVVTWIKGNHTLKGGFNYFWGNDYALFEVANSRPTFTFLNLVDLVRDQPFSGNASARDPLTGNLKPYQFGAKMNTYGLFVQDEWRVRPNLTLTMSLRYDDFGNPAGIRNWQMTNLFLARGSDFDAQVRDAYIRVLPAQFPGRLKNNWSPRFGWAWSPGTSRKWSVRGGIGLYYDWITLGESVDRVNVNPPNFLIPSVGQLLPIKPIFSIGNSDTYPFGYTLPAIPAGRLDERGGIAGVQTGVGGLASNLRPPRTLNYISGVERELPGRTVVGVNYSGSSTWDALVGTNYNRFPGDLLDGRLDRLNPSFGSIQYITNLNLIRYNAMIATVRKDMRGQGLLQASYTLGRVTDYFQGGSRSVSFEDVVDPRQMKDRRADARWDVRHRFSGSGVYRFPTPWRNNRVSKHALGGWEIGVTAILQTGFPYQIANGGPFNPIRDDQGRVIGFRPLSGDYNADGTNFDLPNVPSGLPRIYPRENFLGANAGRAAFNAADFTAPPVGQQGNSPRNYFRQQGFISLDTSVLKNNRLPFLGEAGNLQLKFEFFNAPNRVNLGTINNNIADPNFGRILSQGQTRIVQVGSRISF
jgi:hypothetical protein